MKPHLVNTLNNFMHATYIDSSLCDYLIELHENNPNKTQGTINNGTVNTYVKNSEDTKYIPNSTDIQPYINALRVSAKNYIDIYPMCNEGAPWSIFDVVNIQKYPVKEGGFLEWHTERSSSRGMSSTRHLVFMTYLNDIVDGGETEWFHQRLKIKPEKGLTVIWPADWTFTHRGLPSLTQVKYVITGWFNFYPED